MKLRDFFKKNSRRAKIALIALLAYVPSYYALSRYSHYRYTQLENGERVFFYVPAQPVRVFTSNLLLKSHYCGTILYYPLWLLDFHVLGGPRYASMKGGLKGL